MATTDVNIILNLMWNACNVEIFYNFFTFL